MTEAEQKAARLKNDAKTRRSKNARQLQQPRKRRGTRKSAVAHRQAAESDDPKAVDAIVSAFNNWGQR